MESCCMSSFIDNFSPKEWENFCEVMLRQHFGAKNFYTVPDQDRGDLGIEFFTVTGIIFQCYYPEQGIQMDIYKKRIQKKINDDLKKLKDNEFEIAKLLDNIVIDHWVLLTPENKSKDFISYCNKKKKEIISNNISFIDNNKFSVKIETADSYPHGKLYAQETHSKSIKIPLLKITDNDKKIWKIDNSTFSNNIERKSMALMDDKSNRFQDKVIEKYIQIEKFLDQLRADHPNLHENIEDTAWAQLENIKENSLFESLDKNFVQNMVKENTEAFAKHSKFMSDTNTQSLSFGYLSKWLAECYMDFKS